MSALRSRKTFISSVRMPEHPPFHARRGFEATAPLVALRRSKSGATAVIAVHDA
jgi:hypothetical protein